MDFAWIKLYGLKYVYKPEGWTGPREVIVAMLNEVYPLVGTAVGDPVAVMVAKVAKEFRLPKTDCWVRPLPPVTNDKVVY